VLAIVVACAYGNALHAGFAFDAAAIVGAPQMSAATWENVVAILTHDYWWPTNIQGLYRPLTSLSYLFDLALFGHGGRAVGAHAVNVVLHWANAVLVHAVAAGPLAIPRRPALLIAAAFAAHPLGSEAVTNVVGRADLLAAAFVLGGLLLHERALRARGGERRALQAGLAATALLGFLSKENATALLPVIAGWDALYRPVAAERVTGLSGAARRALAVASAAWRDWLVPAVPIAAVLALRAWLHRADAPVALSYGDNPIVGVGYLTGRLTALALLARSLALVVWPASLCPDYSVAEVLPFGSGGDAWETVRVAAAVAAVGLALVGAVVAARRGHPAGRPLLFFWWLALVTWLPTSNLLFPIGAAMAERFLYLPAIGALGSLVLWIEIALAAAVRRASGPKRAATAAAVASTAVVAIAVAALALRAHARNDDWRDDLALWESAVASCPGSYRAHQALGAWLATAAERDGDAAKLDRAIAEAETAQRLLAGAAPPGTSPPAAVLENLGAFYLRKADLADAAAGSAAPAGDEAAAWRRKAVAALERVDAWYREIADARSGAPAGSGGFQVGVSTVYENLASAHLALGNLAEARSAFERARSLVPTAPAAYLGLAAIDLRSGAPGDALVELAAASLVEGGRADVTEKLAEVDREVHPPDGCILVERGGEVSWNPDCPDTQRVLCRAYAHLAGVFRSAANLSDAERAETVDRLAALARDDGCDAPEARAISPRGRPERPRR